MKRHLLTATALAILATTAAYAGPPAKEATEAKRLGAWGFDLAGRDLSASPGQDFFDYANGAYMKKLVIPPDRTRYGSFDALTVLSENRVHAVLETASANTGATGDAGRIGGFYKAFMDEARVEALDAKPLAQDLAAIRAAATREDLATLMGKQNTGYYSSLIGVGIGTDAKEPTKYAVYVDQAGLGLPDRDYYLEANFAPQKAKYKAYVAQMLGLVEWPDAQAQAKAIVALETEIAQASWSKVEQRDPVKTYNPTTPDDLAKEAPGFAWKAFLTAADLGVVKRVVFGAKTAGPKIAAIFAETPVETLRAWQAFNLVDQASPYLSKRFADAHFEFRNRVLGGQLEQKARWKRAVSAVSSAEGEAVGKIYVDRYFPASSKRAMLGLIGDLRVALKARIQNLIWMSDDTKAKALEKLALLNVKVGYPDKWRDYTALNVTADDLYGDVKRGAAFEWARQVTRLNDPVDRTEWGMTPQTVNAYYSSTENEIVFPAAILQPPFFDPKADMAVNYGGIGGVIGHEMTHGFDDEGRQFDGRGKLADWWTPEDAAKFVAQTKRLGAQYSAFEPLKGSHVNGDLTMGENIADLGGVLLGLDAYHLSLKGKAAPARDGVTGDQRVLFGWAQVWRGAMRDDALRQQLVSNPHSPPHERVVGPVRNVDAWYGAFGVKPGDALYVAPADRVRIW